MEIKKKIEKHAKEWDKYKKYTNTYEYIHTAIPYKKRAISAYKPLSRSYFKMVELIYSFDLLTLFNNMTTFHLAEGPGGFIEAIAKMRNNKNDKYIGMTIIDEADENVPSWKKSELFLKETPNVEIEKGIDGTGNILCFDNFVYCTQKYAGSMDIITADGGFDFSVDFNNQELNIAKLLFAQICYAICIQKKGGHFILKIFDVFFQHTIDMMYLLSCFYESVQIVKPQTSRIANSEKYVICKHFIPESNKHFINKIEQAMYSMTCNSDSYNTSTPTMNYIERILNINVPLMFLTKIEEINAIFGQQQIENIHYTLLLIEKNIKNEKIENIIKPNIIKCIQWCMKYGIPHNEP
jgi:23S rRNA U2552 (ribose-2'-O)-methylase RlmE/FtsJ